MSEKNIYIRNGIYWLQVSVRGQNIRRSLHTSDIKIARKARDKAIEQIKLAKHHSIRNITWGDAVVEWASHISDQLGPRTAHRYACSLKQSEPYLKHLNIDAIDGNVIAEYIAIRKSGGVKAATVKRDLTAISRVLEYADAMGWREGNPTLSKRKLLKERRDPIQLPKHDEIELMLNNSSPCFARLIMAAWLTGCRQNELVMAKWEKFNPEYGTLEVIGKGNKRRVIALSPSALAMFKSLPVLGDYILCKEDGTRFIMASSNFTHIRRSVRAKMATEGRPFVGFRFHDLRHLFAVEALSKGMSIYDLQKHMGHSTIKVTEMYLEFLTPDQHRAAQKNAIPVNYTQNYTQ